MSNLPMSDSDASATKPSLYQEFLAEREEIMRHKWLKSEEAGEDLGFEATLIDWALNEREQWKKEYFKKVKNDASKQG